MGLDEAATRAVVANARRVVVKVGSSSLASAKTGLDPKRVRALVDLLAARHARGGDVILVSSGAITAGLGPLGMARRPSDLAQSQAAAAVGQGLLVSEYTQAFAAHDIRVAQVLLTVGDLARKASFANALRTFGALTRLRVVPIVNENDTVATREIRFGDNDRLAGLVAELVRADALVLLSDVDGLYTAPPGRPGARRLPFVSNVHGLDVEVGQPGPAGVGSGGMVTKLEAARLATQAGIAAVLADFGQAEAALAGEAVGTAFAPSHRRRPRRLGWLADATQAEGRLHVDAGAARALTTTPASLLAAGVVRVEGDFSAGDAVEVVSPDGVVIARGLVNYAAADLPAMLGRGSAELAESLGPRFAREIVHRDDLVLARRAKS